MRRHFMAWNSILIISSRIKHCGSLNKKESTSGKHRGLHKNEHRDLQSNRVLTYEGRFGFHR